MPNKPMDEGTAAALDHNRIIEKLDALAKEASEIAYLAYKRLMTAQVERQGEQGYKEYRELHDKELRTYDRCHKEARAIGEKFMAALAKARARHDWSEAKADKHRTTLRERLGVRCNEAGEKPGTQGVAAQAVYALACIPLDKEPKRVELPRAVKFGPKRTT